MLAAVGFLTVVVVGVLLHNLVVGSRITRLWTPQIEAVTEMELQAATAHLWLEESLSGDRGASLDLVWDALDEARNLGEILVGDQRDDSGRLRALKDRHALAELRMVLQNLQEFRVLSEARVEAVGETGAGSPIDREVDQVFAAFQVQASSARSELHSRYRDDVARFRGVQGGMVAFAVLLAVVVAVGFLRLDRRSVRALSEARRWSEELEQVYATSPIAFALLDGDLRYIRVNSTLAQANGVSPRDHVGKRVQDVVPWLSSEVVELFEQVLATGEPVLNHELEFRSQDGSEVTSAWLMIVMPVQLEHHGGRCLTVSLQDISDLRATEMALRDSEEKLRTIVEHSTNLFYSHTTDHRLTYVSPQVRDILDAEPEEALVRWTDFATDHPLNKEGIASTRAAIETGQAQPPYELELRALSGRLVRVEVREAPVVVNGTTQAIVGALADITEKRQLEEQLLQAQKLEAVGRLAGGVAHDFNNILQALYNQLGLIRKQLGGEDGVVALVDGMQASADRAAGLTRQLLAFSRRQVLRREPLDLGVLVSATLEMLQRIVGEDLEIRFTADADLWPVHADPSQMEQVLTNLVVNARDAMPRGGQVLIRARNEPAGDAGAADRVVLEVIDDGVGMDQDTAQHAFDPFFTTKERGKGTGLGLSTVYGIVSQHDGEVSVASEPLKGATFTVRLPRCEDAGAAEVSEPSPMVLPSGTETILLAEDEPEVRTLTEEVLADAGYRVFAAADGLEALELFAKYEDGINLAVLDVLMPRAGGSEVAERILERRPTLQILFTSGYSEEFVSGKVKLGEGTELIQKPYRLHTLLRTVRRILDEG